jgi:hypothetical protein
MNRRPIMRRRRRGVFVIAFVGISATAGLGMAEAADPASPLIMKPLQGVSFDIGTKRAVSYFLSDGNSCKLTLMLAEVVHGDEVNGPTATRVTVAIEAGKAAHLDTVEGKTLEFKCQGGAHVMSVEASNQATSWRHQD